MTVPDCDIDRIMEVMQQAFDPAYGEAWNRRQLVDALLMPSTSYALIDRNGQMPGEGIRASGFTLSRHILDEEELLLIAVNPAERGQGLGRKLLDNFIASARSRGIRNIFLEMREGNPAEKLYCSAGFAPVGIRPGYYPGSHGKRLDAISFVLNI